MSSILSTLGLRAAGGSPAPSHAAAFLVGNWVFAHMATNSRWEKMRLGIDNNVAPREDLATIGEAAVKEGKISRSTLNRLKRKDATSTNLIDGFPFLVASILFATVAGVPNETINTIGVWYSVSRIAYAVSYIYGETQAMGSIRSLAWLSANISCITGLVLASKRL
ncbi:hypothetical protein N7468_000061 [Penicillium chermesinum]|uniref:Uncharacterized protein n=1 Tax=Penicillium chermesinum TaxID=63820 RepID=A0A9W9PJI5_9EURO|nr:uncharacterized protein N7468_000061 [Penicillium chermesinum]KAJ5248610.1 hypothetical protein N7468_000061 [Penicillium chermesinum]KAJ6150723.1 hypothetical protein N7470_007317 [Penicillium chermesinum]